VVKNVFVFASSILKCISQNRHRAEVSRFVHLTRERKDRVGAPRGKEDRLARLDVCKYRRVIGNMWQRNAFIGEQCQRAAEITIDEACSRRLYRLVEIL